ncbi:MAG: SRPBCC domain-containing protein [Candidatus Moranbacteria bacterium]|jgi:uncharacterized protein YndB with AHSA1/START domain|nr:SRPBCC domain-containing protein [Candidatus Moranbacteria bacterium]MBP9801358.1 SRPBCC domain-containing protein [Candidatus Moranbacteria bacterium]
MKSQLTVEVFVLVSVEKAWQYWILPKYITQWCFASDDWSAPRAENELRVGGKLKTRMEAKDGSGGFDFEGIYTVVEEKKKLEYLLVGDDTRRVIVEFLEQDGGCIIRETFDAEEMNSLEMQKNGWQSILNNFKKLVETA